jgi:hypothetical protein
MLDKITRAPVTIYQNEHDHIEKFVMGPTFPWYWQNQQTFNTEEFYNENLPEWLLPHLTHYNAPFLSHTLLRRSDDENVNHLERHASDFSPHYEFFMEIFHRFTVEQGIPYRKIFRANLNLNWYNGDYHTEPHYDHAWPHHNFIMYLTSCEHGQTILWPPDFLTSYLVPCEQYTAVAFRQQWHAHRYPAQGDKRIVFVVTYI